jgi:hypothetical protein
MNGVESEAMHVIREDDFMVVVSAEGCIFTGDFPHAGVDNFVNNRGAQDLTKQLAEKIDAIMAKHPRQTNKTNKNIINLLCEFENLDTICRMHCSTEPRDSKMTIPRNAIGFSGCRPNPPKNH